MFVEIEIGSVQRDRVRVKVVGGSVCLERERGRVYRERERERDGTCVQREGRSVF